MTNAEIVKGIKCCMLIDYSCDECPYHQYGKTCNTMLYIDVMKFLPPITLETVDNNGKFSTLCRCSTEVVQPLGQRVRIPPSAP